MKCGPHVERPLPLLPGPRGERRGRLSARRRKLLALIATAIVALGIYALIGQATNSGALLRQLRRADGWWFVVAAAGEGISYIAYSFFYRAIVAECDGPRPGFLLSLRITVAGFAAFVVGSAAGNLAVDYWALRRMGEETGRATARVLALNTGEWAVLSLMAWACALAMLAGVGHAPLSLELSWALAFPVCVVGAVALSSPERRTLAAGRSGRLWRALAAVVDSLVVLRGVVADRRALLEVVVAGLAFWTAKLLTAWAALRAFGVNLGVVPLTVAYATGYAATNLPLPAGGVGSVDAARTYAVALVGVPLEIALLGTFAARLFSFWLPIIPAALAARSLKGLIGDLPRVPHGPATGTARPPASNTR